jgi:hypothetical protein
MFHRKRDNTKRDADRLLASVADSSHPRYSELQDSVQVCAPHMLELFDFYDFISQLRKKTYAVQDSHRMFVRATHGVESDPWADDLWSKLDRNDSRCVYR